MAKGLDETNKKFVPLQQINEVSRFKESIRAIKEMVGRDKMKVVFFGRFLDCQWEIIKIVKLLEQAMAKAVLSTRCSVPRFCPRGWAIPLAASSKWRAVQRMRSISAWKMTTTKFPSVNW